MNQSSNSKLHVCWQGLVECIWDSNEKCTEEWLFSVGTKQQQQKKPSPDRDHNQEKHEMLLINIF